MGSEEDTTRPTLTLKGLCSADERRELDKLASLPVQSLLSIILGGLRIIETVCDEVDISLENKRDLALGGLKIREVVAILRDKLDDGRKPINPRRSKKPVPISMSTKIDGRRNWSDERRAKHLAAVQKMQEKRRLAKQAKEGVNAVQYESGSSGQKDVSKTS